MVSLRRQSEDEGHNLVKKLKPGDFVAVQNRADDGAANGYDPYLVGKVVEVENGSVVAKEVTGRSEVVNGTTFDRGDWMSDCRAVVLVMM